MNVVSVVVLYFNAYSYWYLTLGQPKYLIAISVLWTFSFLSFCTTAFKDPGIIGQQLDFDIQDLQCNKAKYAAAPINFTNDGLFRPVRMSNNFLYTSG